MNILDFVQSSGCGGVGGRVVVLPGGTILLVRIVLLIGGAGWGDKTAEVFAVSLAWITDWSESESFDSTEGCAGPDSSALLSFARGRLVPLASPFPAEAETGRDAQFSAYNASMPPSKAKPFEG